MEHEFVCHAGHVADANTSYLLRETLYGGGQRGGSMQMVLACALISRSQQNGALFFDSVDSCE